MTQLFQSTYDGHVNLISCDLSAWGLDTFNYVDSRPFMNDHPDLDVLTWKGLTFKPMPFSTSGYQKGGDALVKPKISIPDFGGGFYVTLARDCNMASGAPITRYQALAEDILSGDENAPFSIEKHLLNSLSYDGMVLEIELATHVDYQRSQFPAHIMYRDEFPGLGSQLAST